MTRQSKEVSATETLSIIHRHNALVKNIETQNPSAEYAFTDTRNSWAFLLRQLKDPENYRPTRARPKGVILLDRDPNTGEKLFDPVTNQPFVWQKYFNPETGQWTGRFVNATKGQPRPGAIYTKKTATSLLPPNGKMHFYDQTNGIVLILDIEKCKIKQYIFSKNIGSNGRWWLYGVNYNGGVSKPFAEGGIALPRSVAIDDIRQQHRATYTVPRWNEILAGLSAEAVIGVGIPENTLLRRLNAQYRKFILLRELNIDVPLFILTTDTLVHEYTEKMQMEDLIIAGKYTSNSEVRDFYKAIFALIPNQMGPLALALNKNNINNVRTLLSLDAINKLPIEALKNAARKKQWCNVFLCLDSDKISDDEKSKAATELLYEAIEQNDLIVLTKLLLKNPLICTEHLQLAKNHHYRAIGVLLKESYHRNKITKEYAMELCAIKNQARLAYNFFSSAEYKNKLMARDQLILLENDITAYIEKLQNDIQNLYQQNTLPNKPHFFSFKEKLDPALMRKNQKIKVLAQTLKLVQQQLLTGQAIDQKTFDEFKVFQLNNPHWSDGIINKHTADLVKRAEVLMRQECGKRVQSYFSADDEELYSCRSF